MKPFQRALLAVCTGLCAACGDDLFDQPPAVGGDLGDIASCEGVADWDAAWASFEEDVLRLVNEARAKGHNCDTAGRFDAADPLAMESHLRCAARMHSGYMAETGDFDHTESANGSDPFDRISNTGYRFRTAGENIAAGQRTPDEVVAGWLESDGHCRNIMDPAFTHLGVGYAVGGDGTPYWTQSFAAPL